MSVSTDRRIGVTAAAAVKVPCKAATTANITLSGEQTIDGVSIVTFDRILVKDQTDTTQNGVYVADTSAWKRAPDFDGYGDVKTGTLIPVNDGNTNDEKVFRVTTEGTIIPGTSSLAFEVALFSSLTGTTFIQSGTGAVERPAQDKMREIVSVFDFMTAAQIADVQAGTALLNVTAAVQATLNTLGTSGGTVYFPPGTYYLLTPVIMDNINRIHFIGAGPASKIKSPDKVSCFAQTPSSDVYANDIEFSHLTFTGSYGPSSPDYGTPSVVGQTAIYLNTTGASAGNRIRVHHCNFENMAGGVFATTLSNLVITDNIFTGCLADVQIGSGGVTGAIIARNIINKIQTTISDDAIAVFGPSTDVLVADNIIDRKRTISESTAGPARIIVQATSGTARRLIIRNNILKNMAWASVAGATEDQRAGILLTRSGGSLANVLVEGNHIYNGMNGIVMSETDISQVRICGNIIDTMQMHGIIKADSNTNNDIDVEDNTVSATGSRGISLAGVTRLGLKGNTVRSSTDLAVTVDACTGVLVESNKITGNSSDGLRINATSYVQIISNVLENNNGWGVSFTGTCTNPNLLGNRYDSNGSGNINNLEAQISATDGDATPSVRNLDKQRLVFNANTNPLAITQLDDGFENMEVTLLGLSSTNSPTIADSGNFRLTGAITIDLWTTLKLCYRGGVWVEIARSVN
jgi:hypothetical protein